MADWHIVGHTWAVQQLQIAIAQNEVPHALLITGPESVGKMTLARTLVAALLCTGSDDARPCGTCLACRKLESGNQPDFMLVAPEDKGGWLKIHQIRALERFLALTPNESACKVGLIVAFDRATIGAANALLKTLEEPPSYAHLILLASDAELLLPTIVSRSQQINLRPLPHHVVEQALITRWQVAPDEAERLARLSGGRIGWAVRAVTDHAYRQRTQEVINLLLDIIQQDIPTRFETAQQLAKDEAHLPELLEYWLTGWRDILLLQTENTTSITHQEHHPALNCVAQHLSTPETVQIIKFLEKAQTALQHNANTQLLIENVLLKLPQVSS